MALHSGQAAAKRKKDAKAQESASSSHRFANIQPDNHSPLNERLADVGLSVGLDSRVFALIKIAFFRLDVVHLHGNSLSDQTLTEELARLGSVSSLLRVLRLRLADRAELNASFCVGLAR